MRSFAEGTSVSAEKTRSELDLLLSRHGASQRATYFDDKARRARIQFSIEDRMVRLDLRVEVADLPTPGKRAWELADSPRGWDSWPKERQATWVAQQIQQREREAWRRLLLVTKAKLEIVADGSSTVEREFLADILLPDGGTVHERLAAQLEASYRDGAMPPLLGDGR